MNTIIKAITIIYGNLVDSEIDKMVYQILHYFLLNHKRIEKTSHLIHLKHLYFYLIVIIGSYIIISSQKIKITSTIL